MARAQQGAGRVRRGDGGARPDVPGDHPPHVERGDGPHARGRPLRVDPGVYNAWVAVHQV